MAKGKGSQNKEPSSGDLDFKILNPITGTPFLFSLNSNSLIITRGGEHIGHTVPLALVDDIAKILGVHRMAIPIHMVEHDLPVYSVGDDVFINLQDLKFLMEEVRFSFW